MTREGRKSGHTAAPGRAKQTPDTPILGNSRPEQPSNRQNEGFPEVPRLNGVDVSTCKNYITNRNA